MSNDRILVIIRLTWNSKSALVFDIDNSMRDMGISYVAITWNQKSNVFAVVFINIETHNDSNWLNIQYIHMDVVFVYDLRKQFNCVTY